MTKLGNSARGLARRWLLACLSSALTATGCSNSGHCLPNPGVCPPSLACVDGFRRTGSASCENGEWVCERVACVSDAGACDGACPDSGSD